MRRIREPFSRAKMSALRLALLALVLYPFVWVALLPFRLVGIAVHGALALVWAVIMLPARLLSAPFRI